MPKIKLTENNLFTSSKFKIETSVTRNNTIEFIPLLKDSKSFLVDAFYKKYNDEYNKLSHIAVNPLGSAAESKNMLYSISNIEAFNDITTSLFTEFKNSEGLISENYPINISDNNVSYIEIFNKYSKYKESENVIDKATDLYDNKNRLIEKFNKLFGSNAQGYSTGNLRAGKANKAVLTLQKAGVYKVNVNKPFFKVENASNDIRMFLIIRGIPVDMDRFETSVVNNSKYNYIFRYPEYILNDKSYINSIEYTIITTNGNQPDVFYGLNDKFGNSNIVDYKDNLVNLNIINYNSRNKTN